MLTPPIPQDRENYPTPPAGGRRRSRGDGVILPILGYRGGGWGSWGWGLFVKFPMVAFAASPHGHGNLTDGVADAAHCPKTDADYDGEVGDQNDVVCDLHAKNVVVGIAGWQQLLTFLLCQSCVGSRRVPLP